MPNEDLNGHSKALVHVPTPPPAPEAGERVDERPPRADPHFSAADEPPGNPWDEGDFNPIWSPAATGFEAENGETYRVTAGKARQHVCGFVPEVLGETVTINDLDNIGANNRSIELNLRISTPDGDATDVVVPVERGRKLSSAIIDVVPSGVARLAVSRPADVGPAAKAFTSGAFFRRTLFGQTGWLPDGSFGFPGSEAVSLQRLGPSKGLALLGIPDAPDPVAAAQGSEVLLRLCSMAPVAVTLLVLATILSGPLFRRLGARGFLVLLSGSSQAAKTPLVSRIGSLLGAFYEQPGCVATWTTTPATIETYLYRLRDLTVLLDNFRAQDGAARETFRRTVISLGDGAARGRSAWSNGGTRVVGANDPRCLVLATGEHGFEDDAGVNGRMIQLAAHGIDRRALLRVPTTDLASLPHLFSGYVAYLASRPPEQWERWKSELGTLAETLTDHAEARTSEHLATLVMAFLVFKSFVRSALPAQAPLWEPIGNAFLGQVKNISEVQAGRVRDEQLDQLVLRELARGIRQGKVTLDPIGGVSPSSPPGEWLGGYDGSHIYLVPDATAKWADEQLRGRRGAGVGRTALAEAFRGRGEGDGDLKQMTIGGRRVRAWPIRRSGLDGAWDGLLDGVPLVGG